MKDDYEGRRSVAESPMKYIGSYPDFYEYYTQLGFRERYQYWYDRKTGMQGMKLVQSKPADPVKALWDKLIAPYVKGSE